MELIYEVIGAIQNNQLQSTGAKLLELVYDFSEQFITINCNFHAQYFWSNPVQSNRIYKSIRLELVYDVFGAVHHNQLQFIRSILLEQSSAVKLVYRSRIIGTGL